MITSASMGHYLRNIHHIDIDSSIAHSSAALARERTAAEDDPADSVPEAGRDTA